MNRVTHAIEEATLALYASNATSEVRHGLFAVRKAVEEMQDALNVAEAALRTGRNPHVALRLIHRAQQRFTNPHRPRERGEGIG